MGVFEALYIALVHLWRWSSPILSACCGDRSMLSVIKGWVRYHTCPKCYNESAISQAKVSVYSHPHSTDYLNYHSIIYIALLLVHAQNLYYFSWNNNYAWSVIVCDTSCVFNHACICTCLPNSRCDVSINHTRGTLIKWGALFLRRKGLKSIAGG